jgi:hypothetical protein
LEGITSQIHSQENWKVEVSYGLMKNVIANYKYRQIKIMNLTFSCERIVARMTGLGPHVDNIEQK